MPEQLRLAAPWRRRGRPPREQELVRVALQYLNGPARCVAFRVNVMGRGALSAAGVRSWAQSAPKGHPDIAGVLPGGRALYVECKARDGELRPHQRAMLATLSRQGALALLVYSLDELRLQMRAAGLSAP